MRVSLFLFFFYNREFDRGDYANGAWHGTSVISEKRDLCKRARRDRRGQVPAGRNKNEDLKNSQARWPFARHVAAAQEWQAASPDRGRITAHARQGLDLTRIASVPRITGKK